MTGLKSVRQKYIIGIDEVGRGPLAGPVTIGAFAVRSEDLARFNRLRLKDSKALSHRERGVWEENFFQKAAVGEVFFSVASVSHTVIDTSGITYAIRLAIKQALSKLKIPPRDVFIFLDGGLKAPPEYLFQQTVIKGDEKIKVIAAASIVAKVARDRKMINYAEKYPQYGFDQHKGYYTKTHVRALKDYGPSPLHRRSYLSFLSQSDESVISSTA